MAEATLFRYFGTKADLALFTLRTSLGAGRSSLVQLVLAECAWLAGLSATVGLAFGMLAAPYIVSQVNPPDSPAQLLLRLDWRAVTFVLAGGHWTAAIVVLFGGALLSRLCYRAAVSQAAEVASLLRVGFDLYRHDILRQMDLEIPVDIVAERALWLQLTAEMLGPQEQPPAATGRPDVRAKDGDDQPTTTQAP